MIGSTLICQVLQRLPFAVVTLAGTLDPHTMHTVEAVLRDCLADMPTALLIEASQLIIADTATAHQLSSIASTAATWPAVLVCLCGLPQESIRDGLVSFSSIEEAQKALGDKEIWRRRLLTLPPVPQSCERARALVDAACADWGMPRYSRLAQLVISELVANGIRHAGTIMQVGIREQNGGLEVSVRDDDPRLIPGILPEDPSGFGLQLVEAMSTTWGCAATGSGKVVWSRI